MQEPGRHDAEGSIGEVSLEVLWGERLTTVHQQLQEILTDLHRQLAETRTFYHRLAVQSLHKAPIKTDGSEGGGVSTKAQLKRLRSGHSLWNTGQSNESLYQDESGVDRAVSIGHSFQKIGQNLIQPWPLWKESRANSTDVVRHMAHEKSKAASMDSGGVSFHQTNSAVFSTAPLPASCTIRPSSYIFLFWNLIFLIVLFYDCVSFPLSAFRIEHLFMTCTCSSHRIWLQPAFGQWTSSSRFLWGMILPTEWLNPGCQRLQLAMVGLGCFLT
eukprot:symbB.v1.2.031277.t1/scaffold3615.1/size53271/4